MIEIKVRPVTTQVNGEAFLDLDLFNDESIEMELSVKKSSDIGSLFADFSKSFTVPATANNNDIFRHFYRDDITDGVGYVRGLPAAIYVNGDEFRTGVLNIQGAQIKDGDPYAYTVQFFSSIQKLNDIGSMQLGVLDFESLNHDYTSANVRSGMRGTLRGMDLIYPLASPLVRWIYETSSSNHLPNNIHYHSGHNGNQHGISYRELKPAISFKAIMEAISTELDITFSGDFYNTHSSLDTTYMWLHTSEGYMDVGSPHERVLLSGGVDRSTVDYLTIQPDSNGRRFFRQGTTPSSNMQVVVGVVAVPSGATTVYLKKGYNGTIVDQKTIYSPQQVTFTDANSQVGEFYYIEVSSTTSGTITIGTIQIGVLILQFGSTFVLAYEYTGGFSIAYKQRVNISRLMPEMTIVEFITAIAKMFNLIIEYNGDDDFKLVSFQDIYASGKVFDLNDYIDTSDVNIQQATTYKSYNLKYSDSKQQQSAVFKSKFQREYGEYKRTNNSNLSNELKIEVPFEIPHMDILGGANYKFPVFLCITDLDGYDTATGLGSSYFGKPIVFSASGELIVLPEGNRISLIDENGDDFEISQVLYFGLLDKNDAPSKSLAFTFDPSIHPQNGGEVVIPDSNQFTNYWESTIGTIDSPYARILSVNGYMNVSDVNRLNLGDLVKFGESLYTIDSLNINITTGEFKMSLLTRL